MSNVFFLFAGRTASRALTKACSHISNYTVRMSRAQKSSDSRVDFCANHIEIDNRLVWLRHLLEEKYGDHAIYLDLKPANLAIAEKVLR